MEAIVKKSDYYGYDNFEVTVYNDNGEYHDIQIHGEETLTNVLAGLEFLGIRIIDER